MVTNEKEVQNGASS